MVAHALWPRCGSAQPRWPPRPADAAGRPSRRSSIASATPTSILPSRSISSSSGRRRPTCCTSARRCRSRTNGGRWVCMRAKTNTPAARKNSAGRGEHRAPAPRGHGRADRAYPRHAGAISRRRHPRDRPYIALHTLAGDHQKRLGFWKFYDQWAKYEQWAGPRPAHDPIDWLAVDRAGTPLPGACGGTTPEYFAPLHRYLTCINHPDWAEWQRRLMRMIAEVGYDGCCIDNVFAVPCYCPLLQAELPPAGWRPTAVWIGSAGRRGDSRLTSLRSTRNRCRPSWSAAGGC